MRSLYVGCLSHHDDDVDDDASEMELSNFRKWKAVCNPKSQTFVFLSCDYICNKGENKSCDVEENEIIRQPTDFGLLCLLRMLAWHYSEEAWSWFLNVLLLVKQLPMLQNVKIIRSDAKGVLFFKNDGYVSDQTTRVLIQEATAKTGKITDNVKIGYLPVLHLPVSGLVMVEVKVAMFRVGQEALDNDVDGYDEVVNWDFEQGEELFGEAVTTIFKNKKNRLFCYNNDNSGYDAIEWCTDNLGFGEIGDDLF